MEMSNEAKNAILNILAHAAWAVPNGQEYYDALADAFFGVASISAVYTPSGTVTVNTPLDDLKADLVVTATLKDSTTQTVPSADYTLSGTLAVGTNEITVSYAGKTTTFNVVVEERFVFKLSDGSLVTQNRGMTEKSDHTVFLWYNNDSTQRRSILCPEGSAEGELYQSLDSSDTQFEKSGYFAIPVPSSATSVSLSASPSGYYIAFSGFKYQNDLLVRTYSGGFVASDPHVENFAAGTYDYITALCKYGSAGSVITSSTEITEFVITFS